MKKRNVILLALFTMLVCVFSFVTYPGYAELKEQHDRAVIIKQVIPPLYGKINEVIIADGIQKYVFFMIKNAKNLVKIGWKGYILNNAQNGKRVGKFKIISIYDDYVKGIILDLNDTINIKAYVRIDRNPLIQ